MWWPASVAGRQAAEALPLAPSGNRAAHVAPPPLLTLLHLSASSDPSTRRLFSTCSATSTPSGSAYVTKPKPLSLPVSGSVTGFHSFSGPQASSSCAMATASTLGAMRPTQRVVLRCGGLLEGATAAGGRGVASRLERRMGSRVAAP